MIASPRVRADNDRKKLLMRMKEVMVGRVGLTSRDEVRPGQIAK